ncbi:hypothetical protein Syun_031925 [Stephania yunnanensis]|uniref:Uncharacterized protein n=1 Tax=Stephania yunnanensis TaxID=152371 RepID=A0AAP0DWP2_9MAGN
MDKIFVFPLQLLIVFRDALYEVHGFETPARKNLLLYALGRCFFLGHRILSVETALALRSALTHQSLQPFIPFCFSSFLD